MLIRRIIGGILNKPTLGRVDDIPTHEAKRLIRAGRAEAVPEKDHEEKKLIPKPSRREEKMVPQRPVERMKPK
jgi:hypothetical protein